MTDSPKIRRPKWLPEQLPILVEVIEELEPLIRKLGNTNNAGAIWESAASKLRDRGIDRLPSAIQRKWSRRKQWIDSVSGNGRKPEPETKATPAAQAMAAGDTTGRSTPPDLFSLPSHNQNAPPDAETDPDEKRRVHTWTAEDRSLLGDIVEELDEERQWFEERHNMLGFWNRVAFVLSKSGIVVSGKAAQWQWDRYCKPAEPVEDSETATLGRIELLLGRLVTAAEKTDQRAAEIVGWLEAIAEQVAAVECKTSTIEDAAARWIATNGEGGADDV